MGGNLVFNRRRLPGASFRAAALVCMLAVSAALPISVAAGSPSNDDFANARLIQGNLPFTETRNTNGASNETEPESECDNSFDASVWYRITPTANRVLRADTLGSDYNTEIDVFTGSSLANLNLVDCNDNIDSNNPDLYTSRVAWNGTAGQRYYIRVTDANQDGGGELHLTVRTVKRLSNDSFANARRIYSLPFDTNADDTNATSQALEPREGLCDVARATRWYKFTPSRDMVIWANTFVPQDFDTVLAVYTGNTIGNANQLVCNDDTWVNSDVIYASGVTFRAHAGVTYHFQVAGYDGESGSNRKLPFHVQEVTPETNDNFANALAVNDLPYSDNANLRRTTVESGEPDGDCISAPLYNTAWYEFNPETTAAYEAEISSGASDTSGIVAVYEVTGSGFGGLTILDCGSENSAATFTGNFGTTYMIQVTADSTQTIPAILRVDFD